MGNRSVRTTHNSRRADVVELTLGPVSASIAGAWVAHATRILAIYRAHRDELPFALPDEVADRLSFYLSSWADAAASADAAGADFVWTGRAPVDEVVSLVRYWISGDLLAADVRERLGVVWSGPDLRPFFDLLAGTILDALAAADAHLVTWAGRTAATWPAFPALPVAS